MFSSTPNHSQQTNDLEALAKQLEQSDDFRVVRRLIPQTQFNPPSNAPRFQACIIDTETTGLDTTTCEIIELGFQIVEFDSEGHLYQVLGAYNYLNEPSQPLSEEVIRITGLTDAQLKGQRIPWQEVAQHVAQIDLFIAHNAGFDRPVLERYHEVFVNKIWGCSWSQIDWANLADCTNRSQEFLAYKLGGFFFEGHRALHDVQALTQLLTLTIGEQAYPALHYLLQAVRQPKTRIQATGAPFAMKDALKQRGYRWQTEQKVWQTWLTEEAVADELDWLQKSGCTTPTTHKLKVTDSFSVRAQ